MKRLNKNVMLAIVAPGTGAGIAVRLVAFVATPAAIINVAKLVVVLIG